MDFFEGVVIEYLRADRALFVNTQYCIQINEGLNPDTSGPHWYCDAVVADFRDQCIFLCEITFANPPNGLLVRLDGWNSHWADVRKALHRESNLPDSWPVRPWLFVLEKLVPKVIEKCQKFRSARPDGASESLLPVPRITPLEMVMPWHYTSWNRHGEKEKPAIIPTEMQ